jgi:fatty-acyl-CoA synthase
MYHVFGYVEGLLSVLFVGGAVIPRLRFDATDTLTAIEQHAATDALLIPMMTMAVLKELRAKQYDLSSLRSVLASGGRAPEWIWAEIRDTLGVREITTGYGMTETTASTTVTRPDDSLERLITTNGRQRDAGAAGSSDLGGKLVVYQVVDTENGAVLSPGGVGELVARGPGVTRGYYDKPEATAAAFTDHGWFKTGDLGKIDRDGYITLLGRSKESYRCGGEQVLPSEIEDVLVSDPDVLQAHIVPIPDERMGEVGVAFIVARPGSGVSAASLRDLTSARLARFKVPRHFLMVSETDIPTTASGRARKFLLAQEAIRMLGLG